MKPPLLLVVTPTLGDSKFLSETAVSVARLRLPLIHYVITPARSVPIVAAQCSSNARIVTERGEIRSMYDAINCAVQDVQEPWTHLTYINDDDVLLPEFAEALAKTDVFKYDLIFGRCYYFRDSKVFLGEFPIEPSIRRWASLFRSGIVGFCQPGTVISRKVWNECGPFSRTLRLNADAALLLKIAQSRPWVRYTGHAHAAFRISENQMSRNRDRVFLENEMIIKELPPGHGFADLWAVVRFRFRNLKLYIKRVWKTGSLGGAYENR